MSSGINADLPSLANVSTNIAGINNSINAVSSASNAQDVTNATNAISSSVSFGNEYEELNNISNWFASKSKSYYMQTSYYGVTSTIDCRWTGAFGCNMQGFCDGNNITIEPGTSWIVTGQFWDSDTASGKAVCTDFTRQYEWETKYKRMMNLMPIVQQKIQNAVTNIRNSVNSITSAVGNLQQNLTNNLNKLKSDAALLVANLAKVTEEANAKKAEIEKYYTGEMARIRNDYATAQQNFNNNIAALESAYKLKEEQAMANYKTSEANLLSQISTLQSRSNQLQSDLNNQIASTQQQINAAQQLSETKIAEITASYEASKKNIENQLATITLQLREAETKLEQERAKYNSQLLVIKQNYESSQEEMRKNNEIQLSLIRKNYEALEKKYNDDAAMYADLLNRQKEKMLELQSVMSELENSIQQSREAIKNQQSLNATEISKLTADFDNQTLMIENAKKNLLSEKEILLQDFDKFKEEKIAEFAQFAEKLKNEELDLITAQNTTQLAELKLNTEKLEATRIEISNSITNYTIERDSLQKQISDANKLLSSVSQDAANKYAMLSTEDRQKLAKILLESSESQNILTEDYKKSINTLSEEMRKSVDNMGAEKDALLKEIKEYKLQRDILETNYNKVSGDLLGKAAEHVQNLIRDYKEIDNTEEAAKKIVLDEFLTNLIATKSAELEEITKAYEDIKKKKDDLDEIIKKMEEVAATESTGSGMMYYVIGALVIGVLGYIFYKSKYSE